MQVLTRLFCVLFFIFFLFGTVNAGSFKVFPLKLELTSKTKTTLFKITNTGNSPVTVQLETASWIQDEIGDDKYNETQDIVYFPKIVKVEAGQQRIIRVGYKGKKVRDIEKTYRIFAQELPELGDAKGALKFSLRFSVPIFVLASGSESKAKVEDAALSNGQLKVFVKNTGTEHFVVKGISVNGIGYEGQQVFSTKTGGWYVLSEANRPFSVKIPEIECRLSEKLSFKVETSIGAYADYISVDSRQCVVITEINRDSVLSFDP